MHNDAPMPTPSYVPMPLLPYYIVIYSYAYQTPCGFWYEDDYTSNRHKTEEEARKYMARVIERADNPKVELYNIELLLIDPSKDDDDEYFTLIERQDF